MTDFATTTKTFYGGTEVRPGALWREPLEGLHLTYVVECVSVNPDRFVGRAYLNRRVLLTTEPVADFQQAARQAQSLLLDRLVALLAGA